MTTFAECFDAINHLAPDGCIRLSVASWRYEDGRVSVRWEAWLSVIQRHVEAETPELLVNRIAFELSVGGALRKEMTPGEVAMHRRCIHNFVEVTAGVQCVHCGEESLSSFVSSKLSALRADNARLEARVQELTQEKHQVGKKEHVVLRLVEAVAKHCEVDECGSSLDLRDALAALVGENTGGG